LNSKKIPEKGVFEAEERAGDSRKFFQNPTWRTELEDIKTLKYMLDSLLI
jgi:hypothetical protein